MSGRVIVSSLIGAALLLSASVASVQAQGTTPPPTVSQLLAQYPNAGADFINQIRSLLAADKNNLAAIIAAARTANEDQRKALAQALADYAKSVAAGDPAFANQIQQAVATSGIPEFAKAYADAAGDTGTAATGGGGGAGGGGGGGPSGTGAPTGGLNSSGISTASNAVTNQGTNLLTGQTLGSTAGTSTSTTTTNTFTQVSTF